MMPVLQAWGTIVTPCSSASWAMRTHSEMPPARVTSGWMTSTLAALHQLRETPARGVLLATGDARLDGVGELAVARDVVRPERFFHPVRSILLEAPHLPDGVVGVRPAEPDIEHQVDLIAGGLAGGAHEGHIEIGIATEGSPAEFDRREAALDQLGHDAARSRPGCPASGCWHRRGSPCDGDRPAGDGSADPSALPLMSQRAMSMPLMAWMAGPCAAVVDRAAVELVPETVDLQRILADQEMTQPAGDGVRRRGIDDRFHHRRQRIDLAEAGDPLIGLDADQQRVLAAVGLGDVHLRLAQDDGLDIGDLQSVLPLPAPARRWG